MLSQLSRRMAALRLSASHRASAAAQASRAMSAEPAGADDHPDFPMARPGGGDPPPEYGQLRGTKPVSKARLFDGSTMWHITKHRDLEQVLCDNRLSKVRTHPGFPELVPGAKAAIQGREPTFVDMDPPDHTKYRGMFEPWFTRERCEALRPDIRAKVDDLIDHMEHGNRPVDLHEQFSLPLAFEVIMEIMGVPTKDLYYLIHNIAARSSGSSTARDAAAAQQELIDYMDRLVADKEKSPADDMLSQVIQKEMWAGNISREHLVAHAFLLLVAGNATVASMINLGVVELLGHPDQLEAFKKDPEGLAPNVALEICRYHTASALALRRVALEDVRVRDVTIPQGEGLIALNMSANRDEEVFSNPDSFDIRRTDAGKQVAYGSGTHRCIAEALSLVELQEAYTGLFRRLPGLKLGVTARELQWSDPKADVGLASLPVTW